MSGSRNRIFIDVVFVIVIKAILSKRSGRTTEARMFRQGTERLFLDFRDPLLSRTPFHSTPIIVFFLDGITGRERSKVTRARAR